MGFSWNLYVWLWVYECGFVCLYVLLLRIIVYMCGWYIVYVYGKVQTLCVVLTGVSYFGYIILFLYV